jgi:UDP-N-acetylmuramoyl-tripeptide--D-alanyl-D-alanine ligase
MGCALNTGSLAWVADALSEQDGLLVTNGLGTREKGGWVGATIDSRAECSGRLFFALKGENTDGHLFAKEAFGSGCVAVVIEDVELSRSLAEERVPYLLVSSCLRALQHLAWAYRRCLDVRVVAITGSTGKTSTKEYISPVIKSKFRVFSSPGNFNNLIGVPLTILETESENEYLVCEVGANQLGEIDFLSDMLKPDIGVITNIGDAHVGMFGSVENIVRAKGELLDNLEPSGWAVLPRDDAHFERLKQRATARTVTFGMSAESDFRVTGIHTTDEGLSFAVNGEAITLCALGEYNAVDASAAFAVGDICGVEPARIRAALAEVKPLPGRGRVHRVSGVTVIDESYNASPASMHASLSMLAGLDAPRRLAVLGDMKELGEFSFAKHAELGARLAQSAIDGVFWFGDNGGVVKEGFLNSGGNIPFHVHTRLGELVDHVRGEIVPRDVVLVKASRACNLDRFVARILDELKSQAES